MNNLPEHTAGHNHCPQCHTEVDVHYGEYTIGKFQFWCYCALCDATFTWQHSTPFPRTPTKQRNL